jgi:hypothetical protein
MAPALRSGRAPPPFRRTTALVPVALTRAGRRHARKLCLDPAPLYLYSTTDAHGATRYHLTDTARATCDFDRLEAVPEHVVVA